MLSDVGVGVLYGVFTRVYDSSRVFLSRPPPRRSALEEQDEDMSDLDFSDASMMDELFDPADWDPSDEQYVFMCVSVCACVSARMNE